MRQSRAARLGGDDWTRQAVCGLSLERDRSAVARRGPPRGPSTFSRVLLIARLGKPFFLAVGLHGAHSPYVIEDPSSADQAAAALAASGRLPLDFGEAGLELGGLTREGRAIAAGRDSATRNPSEDLSAYEEQQKEWRSPDNRRQTEQAIVGYAAKLVETDRRVGFILAALDAAEGGRALDLCPAHRRPRRASGEKAVAVGSKWTLWQPTSRVPLIIADPRGGHPRGNTVRGRRLARRRPSYARRGWRRWLPSGSSRPLAGSSLLAHLADGGGGAATLRHRMVLVTSHCPGRTLLGYAVRGFICLHLVRIEDNGRAGGQCVAVARGGGRRGQRAVRRARRSARAGQPAAGSARLECERPRAGPVALGDNGACSPAVARQLTIIANTFSNNRFQILGHSSRIVRVPDTLPAHLA